MSCKTVQEQEENLLQANKEMDDLLLSGGILHGLPLGLGHVPIETNLKLLRELQTHLSENGFDPKAEDELENQQEEDVEPCQPEAGDADSSGDQSDSEIVEHRSFELRRPWKGYYGTVQIFKTVQEPHRFIKFFDPENPNLARLSMVIKTMSRRTQYNLVKAEITARQKLEENLTETQKLQYCLTDSFYVFGKSGVVYLVRKNRPTIALRRVGQTNTYNPLCALCLHPLAYYSRTWAGAMSPSDEVLSHLLMIRAGEHFFWRKANQIPIRLPNSGV